MNVGSRSALLALLLLLFDLEYVRALAGREPMSMHLRYAAEQIGHTLASQSVGSLRSTGARLRTRSLRTRSLRGCRERILKVIHGFQPVTAPVYAMGLDEITSFVHGSER